MCFMHSRQGSILGRSHFPVLLPILEGRENVLCFFVGVEEGWCG